MLLFDKLKQLFKFDISISDSFNIHINKNSNNTSEPWGYNESTKQFSIDLDKIHGEDLKNVKHLLAESLNEDFTFLEQKSDERVYDIIETEKDEGVHDLLLFFSDKIPKNDFDALRSAVYIRALFTRGTDYDTIYRLKGEVIKKHGKRGLNICNLCTSGYFEKLLIPLYKEIEKSPTFSNDKFDKLYNTIMDEEAFAVFIKSSMPISEVRYIIESQIRRNSKYGIKYVNIHGIGHGNISKIKEVISNIQISSLTIHKEIEIDENIILATLLFDDNENKKH